MDETQPEEEKCVSLPLYQWQRERLWPDWLTPQFISTPPQVLPDHAQHLGNSRDNRSQPLEDTSYEQGHSQQTQEPVSLSVLEKLEKASAEQKEEIINHYIAQQVIDILELGPEYVLEPQKSLLTVGLNSLSAVQLLNNLRQHMQCPLPATLFFSCLTIEQFSTKLLQEILPDRIEKNNFDLKSQQRPGPTPLSFAQQRLWFLDQLEPGNIPRDAQRDKHNK